MNSGQGGEDSETGPFRAGVAPMVSILVAVAVIAVANNGLQAWVLGPDPAFVTDELSQLPALVLMAGITLVVFRVEGVHPSDIGLDRRKVKPALVGVAVVVVAVNATAAALVVIGDGRLTVGLFALYARVLDHTPEMMAVAVVTQYLFVGPVEELVFRGYMQNKLLTLVGGTDSRSRTAFGILLTALAFAVVHVPSLVLQKGVGTGALVLTLVMLVMTALVFGAIYELTGNLYLVAMLHGIGNYWLLVVDPGTWPNWGIILAAYTALVVFYRRSWASSDRTPLRMAG